MKKKFLLLFLLPTFLVSCNSNWHNIDAEQANDIANSIIEYNKQNRPIHAIKNTEIIEFNGTKSKQMKITKNYAAYNLNQYCLETTNLIFGSSGKIPISLSTTIYRVENSNVVELWFDNMKITAINVYAAKNNEKAKELFKTILDEQFNSYNTLDDLINLPIIYHNQGIVSHNPLTDGNSKMLAKNNNSLDIKSNYHLTRFDDKDLRNFNFRINNSSIAIENYRCLEYKFFETAGTSGHPLEIAYKSTIYDYDTPVYFDDINASSQ